jgi:hypothetical protein
MVKIGKGQKIGEGPFRGEESTKVKKSVLNTIAKATPVAQTALEQTRQAIMLKSHVWTKKREE